MRYFIDLSYNGAKYHGWQMQPNATTVQAVLNHALSTLIKTPLNCMGAGRTDTGVHALKMMAHFDCEQSFDTSEISYKLNAFLPKDIAIKSIKKVQKDAHARFDALSRTYTYRISTIKDVFKFEKSHYFSKILDLRLMNDACQILKDCDDFECFSKAHTDVKTFFCQIHKAEWVQTHTDIEFIITADRFLRNMVRSIVGTLLDVGTNKISLEDFRQIIKSKDRSKAGASVPAKGLYLTEIKYPNTIYSDV